ncbi:hypothetical protein RI065_00705 [Mycoplasmatota bacterium zrk1]
MNLSQLLFLCLLALEIIIPIFISIKVLRDEDIQSEMKIVMVVSLLILLLFAVLVTWNNQCSIPGVCKIILE